MICNYNDKNDYYYSLCKEKDMPCLGRYDDIIKKCTTSSTIENNREDQEVPASSTTEKSQETPTEISINETNLNSTTTDDKNEGRCGISYGNKKCPDGQCCSKYGWCGQGDTYCGVGCQIDFGLCDKN